MNLFMTLMMSTFINQSHVIGASEASFLLLGVVVAKKILGPRILTELELCVHIHTVDTYKGVQGLAPSQENFSLKTHFPAILAASNCHFA